MSVQHGIGVIEADDIAPVTGNVCIEPLGIVEIVVCHGAASDLVRAAHLPATSERNAALLMMPRGHDHVDATALLPVRRMAFSVTLDWPGPARSWRIGSSP